MSWTFDQDGTVIESEARLHMVKAGWLHHHDGQYLMPDGSEVAVELVERWLAAGYIDTGTYPLMLNPWGLDQLAAK